MSDVIELIKNSPDSIKAVGYFIAYTLAVVLMLEKLYALYAKSATERRQGKAEELSALKDLVGGDKVMEGLVEDARHQEAFLKLTKLNPSKKRREELLVLQSFGFLRMKDLKMVDENLTMLSDGKFKINFGLAEFLMSVFGILGILVIGIMMLTVNFLAGPLDLPSRLASLFVGACMIFGIAISTRDSVQSVRLSLITARELRNIDRLEGESEFRCQLKTAWTGGRAGFWSFCATLLVMLTVAWGWAYYLKS